MSNNFRERFNIELTKDNFWNMNKKIGIFLFVVFLAVIMFNTTGCTQNNSTEDITAIPSPEQTKQNEVKVGNDGVNAAIAGDDDVEIVSDQNALKNNNSMVAMSVEDMGRSDPFLPESEKVVVKPKPKNFDLMPPPESIVVDSTATDVMATKVSGIMFDSINPSAILNISGADYLVRSGDIINGYKILSIGRDTVTVQFGSNVYKAGVGELFTGDGINFNTISNLESKFGGIKNSVNKK